MQQDLAAEVDWLVLAAVVGNLLQNAFKFIRPHSAVTLAVRASVNRVLIEIHDGIQPALALVPIVPFLPHRPRDLDVFVDGSSDSGPVPGRFEQVFRFPVQVVLLFFGLVNGGVVLAKEMPGAWGVLMAALVGRPVGILVAVALALTMGLRLPEQLRWRELIVVSLSASAGFAFALFFATAIMPPGPVLGDLKLGALSTGVGALIAFAAARLLHVGRFAPGSAASTLAHARRPTRRHAHAAG